MPRLVPAAALLMALGALAACQTERREAALLDAPQRPQGIEGSWDADGGALAYRANFQAGQFTSVESATGATLATGSYRSTGPGAVTIDYTSTRRNQRFAVNCNQIEVNRLACASSNGNRFSFVRRREAV